MKTEGDVSIICNLIEYLLHQKCISAYRLKVPAFGGEEGEDDAEEEAECPRDHLRKRARQSRQDHLQAERRSDGG